MANKQNRQLLIGAAMAAGLLGTLTTLLFPKKNERIVEKAKEIAHKMVLKRKETSKNLLLGGAAGGLLGVTAALLLAPKSGSELIKDMYNSTASVKQAASHAKKAVKKSVKQKAAELHPNHVTKLPKAKTAKTTKTVKAKTSSPAKTKKASKSASSVKPDITIAEETQA